MNIIHKLTLRHLKENKRRTIVTIIGVVISVAMITAVATLGTSFLNLAQKEHIANEGEWHALYKDVTEEQLENIKADQHTDKVILSNDLGYSYLHESKNSSKPYLFFKQYNAEGFKQFPIEIIEGNFPESDDELLISEHISTNGQVDLEIGDEITASIGKRVVEEDPDLADLSLGQTFSLQTVDDEVSETLEASRETQFTIVGIMERPTWEPYMAPGFTVLSYIDEDEDSVNASVVWNKINQQTLNDAEELGKTLNIGEVSFNDGLLRYYGLIDDDFLRTSLYSVAAIIMIVIMVGSVSLIYNAFAISVSERSRHLGMLSSVGATKRQKRNSVFFEGFVIGIVSIPLGIISGIGGIAITFYFINPLFQRLSEFSEGLTVVVTPISIVVAVAVSILTIFISTYIPARRASKVSAIDAIRQSEDVKLSRKKMKTSKFIRKVFGIEAEFGLKNLKRNKRRYIATIFSLVISIVLFLSVSFFGDQLRVSSNAATSGLNYDIKINQAMNAGESFDRSLVDSVNSLEEITDLSEFVFAYVEAELTEDQLGELLGTSSEGGKHSIFIELNVLDDEDLQSYAEEVDVSYNTLIDLDNLSGIVINRTDSPGDKMGEVAPVDMSSGESLDLQVSGFDWDREEDRDLGELEITALTDIRPLGVDLNSGLLQIVVSKKVFAELNQANKIDKTAQLVLTSSDPLATHGKLEKILDTRMYIDNPSKIRQEEEGVILLVSVFTYGFIALITAISVANIFNTISTSISLRKREFGMLKSVGMTPKGFNRMINYESLFYGIKSLLYGLPISIGIMYLIYKSMSEAFEYPFEFPWGSIIGVIVGVFIIVGSAMLYASAKVKKENIIDALKQENI